MLFNQTDDFISHVGVEGNQTHYFLSHRTVEISLYEFNQIRKIGDAFFSIVFHGIDVSGGEFIETIFDGGAPNNVVHKQGDLCGVLFDPLDTFHLLLRFKGLGGYLVEGLFHDFNHILHVNFYFSLQFFLDQIYGLGSDAGNHFSHRWTVPGVFERQFLDGLEDFAHMFVDFFWTITIGQDIQ